MKRIIIVMATVLLIIGIVFAGCTTTEPEEGDQEQPGEEEQEVGTIEWRMASFVPAVDVFSIPVTEWGNMMEEKTGGRFKLFTYFADSLVKSQGLLDAVESGTTDISMMTVSAWSERLPFQAPFAMMPSPFDNPPHIAKGILHMYEWLGQKYPQYMEKFYGKTKIMWLNQPAPRSLLLSNKPVKTLADMKGLKVTATSAEDIKGFGLLGAVTVPLFTGDHYMGLQTGVIDALHNEYNQAWLWRTYEVTKYRIENTVKKGGGYPTTYNPDSYNKLPADIKAIFDASLNIWDNSILYNSQWQAWHDAHKIVLEKWYEDHNLPAATYHYVLPDDESKKWNDLVAPVIRDWVDRVNKAGLPGTEYWTETLRYADEVRAQTAADLAKVLPGYLAEVQAAEAAAAAK